MNKENNYLGISQAAKYLQVSQSTLRRWEKNGRLHPLRTAGGTRRYTRKQLDEALGKKQDQVPPSDQRITIGYCRVSTAGQKEDLKRQIEVVSNYCEVRGYQFKIIQDIGTGMNYHKKGLQGLLKLVCEDRCERIVINYKDRLVRFGYELIEEVCQEHHTAIEIINQTSNISDEQELVDDVLSVITVFSAKLYGKRSHKNQEIVSENKKMFEGKQK